MYSRSLSNGTLRRHLDNHHVPLYLKLVKERGWKNMLPSFASQAQSQAASKASTLQVRQWDKFTQETFHRSLLNFIVMDDQVHLHLLLFLHSLCLCSLLSNYKSLNIVECQEFRRLLLLLQSDLDDTQIPHQTKLHKLLLQAWANHFQDLCHDLVACLALISFDTFSHSFINTGFCGAGLLYIGYVVRLMLRILFSNNSTLDCGGWGIQDITTKDVTYSLSCYKCVPLDCHDCLFTMTRRLFTLVYPFLVYVFS